MTGGKREEGRERGMLQIRFFVLLPLLLLLPRRPEKAHLLDLLPLFLIGLHELRSDAGPGKK